MEFKQAAKLAKKGKKIRRKGWQHCWYLKWIDISHYVWVMKLKDRDFYGGFSSAAIDDTLANDWEEVK